MTHLVTVSIEIERVYMAAELSAIESLRGAPAALATQGLKTVILTGSVFSMAGATLYLVARKVGRIRLIVDSRFVLTSDVAPDRPCSCLFSAGDTLIALFKEAMKTKFA